MPNWLQKNTLRFSFQFRQLFCRSVSGIKHETTLRAAVGGQTAQIVAARSTAASLKAMFFSDKPPHDETHDQQKNCTDRSHQRTEDKRIRGYAVLGYFVSTDQHQGQNPAGNDANPAKLLFRQYLDALRFPPG